MTTEEVIENASTSFETEVDGGVFEKNSATLIVGLGRFGIAMATTLTALGEDILCVDANPKLVQYYSTNFPCVEADMTDEIAAQQIGLDDFTTAVVAIGGDIEASVLVAGFLLDSGIKQVWAKAISEPHARILERIGVQHIARPEADAGSRVAHLISGRLLDYISVDDNFVIAKMYAPSQVQGFTLEQSRIRTKYGITILGRLTHGEEIESATQDTRILKGDMLVVGGAPELVERFARKGR
ncbi:potassium transporter [Actinomycetota bacterium]|nr:potassium transporter [Actinomycetota bacterium]